MNEEGGAFAIPALLCASTLVLLASRRFRADGIAVLALAAAVVLGLIPPGDALSGLAEPVVATVASLAILGSAVHRSGLIDLLRNGLFRRFRPTTPVLMVSGVLVAALAAVCGRITTRAALAGTSPRPLEDPAGVGRQAQLLSAACLIGGLLTLVGGVPNLLVSAVRRDMVGAEFGMLFFLPVGGVLLCAGLIVFGGTAAFARRTRSAPQAGPVSSLRRVKTFTCEIALPAHSPALNLTVGALEDAAGGPARVVAIVREGLRRLQPRPDWRLEPGDLLVLDSEPAVLQHLMERYGLEPPDGRLADASAAVVEAVVTQSSDLIGRSVGDAGLAERFGARLLAIGRNDDHPSGRLRRTRLRAGDILVFGGDVDALPAALNSLGCLLLGARRLRAGLRRQIILPVATLLAALGAATAGLAPLWVCLLLGVLALVLSRALTLQEAYDATPWPGLVMLATLLPLATALHGSTAAAALVRAAVPLLAPLGLGLTAAGVIAATVAATWLFGSTAAVLLVAPFAIAVALAAQVPPDMLLAAVAVGAAVDLLDNRSLVGLLVPGPSLRRAAGWRGSLIGGGLLLCFGTAAVVMVWGA